MKYTKPFWAIKQITRETGLLEDVCECGVGHPNIEFLRANPSFSAIHGCDGCCRQGISEKPKSMLYNQGSDDLMDVATNPYLKQNRKK